MVRSDLPMVRGATPTLFNAIGSGFGLLAGVAGYATAALMGWAPIGVLAATSTAAATTLAAPLAAAAAAGAVGWLVGGLVGKSRMEKERVTGTVPREPGFLNRGLVTGLFLGATLALAAAMAPSVGITLLPQAMAGMGWLAAAGVAAVPAVVGSLLTRTQDASVYATAAAHANGVQIGRQVEAAKARGLDNVLAKAVTTPAAQPQPVRSSEVTQAEAAELDRRQAAGRSNRGTFEQQVLASRAAAQTELSKA